jgi:acyl carrier protein
MESEIRNSLMRLLGDKLNRVGIAENELGDRFDLVKSGLVNSLEFVDMVAALEKEWHCEIDFEAALDKGDLTTLGGLVKTFESARNG